MDARATVVEALRDAAGVVFPVLCAGCGMPDRALCARCRDALEAAARVEVVELTDPERADRPLRLWHAAEYSGVVTAVLHAVKEGGRTQLARPLGALLRPAVLSAREESRGARAQVPPPRLLAVPSSRASARRRGFNPVDILLRSAGFARERATGIRYRRTPADQAGLGAEQRWQNLAGALEGDARRLARRAVILVDDVATTGATLLECRRAVESAGGVVVSAVSLAYTRKLR